MPEGYQLEMGEKLVAFDLLNGTQKHNKAARVSSLSKCSKGESILIQQYTTQQAKS